MINRTLALDSSQDLSWEIKMQEELILQGRIKQSPWPGGIGGREHYKFSCQLRRLMEAVEGWKSRVLALILCPNKIRLIPQRCFPLLKKSGNNTTSS